MCRNIKCNCVEKCKQCKCKSLVYKAQKDSYAYMVRCNLDNLSLQEISEKFNEVNGYIYTYTENSTDIKEFSSLSLFNLLQTNRNYTAFVVVWYDCEPIWLYGTESSKPYETNCKYGYCYTF